MSTHTFFSNQSQRYSSIAASSPSSNGTLTSQASADPPPRPARTASVSSRSRLSLSVGPESMALGNGNGALNGNGTSAGGGGESPKGLHPLRSTWVFWYRQQRGGKVVNYEEGIKKIAPFGSIESFWTLWTHIQPPSTLTPTTDYLLFHSAVKRPVWEDPLNKSGGKWIIRLKKGVSDRLWEDLVLAVIGDQFEEGDNVCGCVLSVRAHEDIMSVWHQDESDGEAKERIRETIKRCLHLNASTTMEYKTNNDSLHDKSSFRTQGAERATPNTEKS